MTQHKNLILWLIFAMVLWGLSWPSAKITTQYADTTTLLFWRFILSAIGVLPVLIVMKQTLRFSKKALRSILIASVFICAYNYFFFLALHHGLAGLGGVLVTTLNPLITFFLVTLWHKKRLPLIKLTGLFMGLFGGLLILRIWELSWNDLTQGGNILFVIAAGLWSGLTLSSAAAKEHINAVAFSFYLYIITALFSLFFTSPQEILQTLEYDWVFWGNMLFVSVITTAIATTIYLRASGILGSATASSFIFLVPATAIIGSYIALDEVPLISTIAGGIICIMAVAAINKK